MGTVKHITLIGWALTFIGVHLAIYFSSWPHGRGDTLVAVTGTDTFIIAVLTCTLSCMWVDGVFDDR